MLDLGVLRNTYVPLEMTNGHRPFKVIIQYHSVKCKTHPNVCPHGIAKLEIKLIILLAASWCES